ncbi:hypothetical protein D3C87_278850 [compost metagenome]
MTTYKLSDGTTINFRHAGNLNGVTNEELIAAVMARLTEQDNAVPSIHNHMALRYLDGALDHLKRRHELQAAQKNANQDPIDKS